jgi:hypothetical protein
MRIPIFRYTLHERLEIIRKEKDPEYIHELLSKFLCIPIEVSKERYSIQFDLKKSELSINSNNTVSNYILVQAMLERMELLSITPLNLRCDLFIFVNKIH